MKTSKRITWATINFKTTLYLLPISLSYIFIEVNILLCETQGDLVFGFD